MTPRARRIVVPVFVSLLVLAMVWVSFRSGGSRSSTGGASAPEVAAPQVAAEEDQVQPDSADAPGAPETELVDTVDGAGESDAAPQAPLADGAAVDGAAGDEELPSIGPALALDRLIARATGRGMSGVDQPAASIGSLDPEQHAFLLELSRSGAGIASATLSDVWETARARQQSRRYRAALATGRTLPDPPDDDQRYRFLQIRELRNARLPGGIQVPELAANEITVNGVRVNLLAFNRDEMGNRLDIWSEVAPGHFETEIVTGDDRVIARVTRRYEISNSYDLTLRQRIENLTDQPLTIEWLQFGPSDLRVDRARYIDRRRFRFGYLVPSRDPQRLYPTSDDSGLIFERASILKRPDLTIWPNNRVREEG